MRGLSLTSCKSSPAFPRAQPCKRTSRIFLCGTDSGCNYARAMFPLGEMSKRRGARSSAQSRHGSRRKGGVSGDLICSRRQLRGLIDRYLAATGREKSNCTGNGEIVDARGGTIGTSRRYSSYTMGQRRGIGIAAQASLYVVVQSDASPTIACRGQMIMNWPARVIAAGVNWVALDRRTAPVHAEVRVRYRHTGGYCHNLAAGRQSGASYILMNRNGRSRPGQATVFYGDEVVAAAGSLRAVGRAVGRRPSLFLPTAAASAPAITKPFSL